MPGEQLAAANPADAPQLAANCRIELNKAVSHFNAGYEARSAAVLSDMSAKCAMLPQLHHNLGVIAANTQQWKLAQTHFNRAISADLRTNMTHRYLQLIHEYKATLAYRKALGVDGNVPPPELEMQGTQHINAEPDVPTRSRLHNIAAVDYELYAWWQAAASHNMPDWLEHYFPGYPPPDDHTAHALASSVSWQNVDRQITFTAKDAVVILQFDDGSIEHSAVLLLRLQNNRWKIYQETAL